MKPTRELLITAVALALTACAGVSAGTDGTDGTDDSAVPIVAEVGALPGAATAGPAPAAGAESGSR